MFLSYQETTICHAIISREALSSNPSAARKKKYTQESHLLILNEKYTTDIYLRFH
jgi:hypothetical protein